jgi:hypothetical protein
MLDVAAQRLDQMRGAGRREAYHVDDDVGLQLADFCAERAGLFLGIAVELDRANRLPGSVRAVRRALAAADVDHLESGLDEAGYEIGSDVAAATDDHDARHGNPPEARIMRSEAMEVQT